MVTPLISGKTYQRKSAKSAGGYLDATGNVMCIYTRHGDTLTAGERPIYGSKRLGELQQQIKIGVNGLLLNYHTATIGFRHYELTDHLGNVMAVVSDRKRLSTDSVYIPDVISYTDYYPFGFPMENRSWQMSGYRHGFNGQESDDEVYGEKQSYTAEFWQYDSRLGRRWNVDPVTKPDESPYACFADNPVWFVDIAGDSIINAHQNDLTFAKALVDFLKEEINKYSDNPESDNFIGLSSNLKNAEEYLATTQEQYDFAQSRIFDLKISNPELFKQLNNIKDQNGETVDIYVNTNYQSKEIANCSFDYENNSLKSRYGKNSVALNINPLLDMENKDININSEIINWGKVLSHERGHLMYIIPNHITYRNWLIDNGHYGNENYGGHGKGDLSGEEARRQEDYSIFNR